eukprot:TRINITY_DN12677_c0_g1_i1.p1 TRINITY_DN12677_c0_g1~~TRINITY_DN12677_c0_g1_i1.p1  ORF type:complete len:620 (-),score=243.45 TRINITY_DN12677_c0_g1_i1:20-1831(-)
MGLKLILFFAILVPLVIKITDLENFHLEKSDKVYDLKTLKGPVLSGFPLQGFNSILKTPIGSLIIPLLLKDNQFPSLAPFGSNLDEIPTLLPLYHPSDKVVKEAKEKAFNLEAFTQQLSSHPDNSKTTQVAGVEEYAAAYRSKQITPTQALKNILSAVKKSEALDPPLRIFIAIDEADVLKQAEASTQRFAQGTPLSILDGVPVAVKDEVDVKGYVTTVGSRFLNVTKATADATIVARLREKGAIIVGKTNMHEFGMGTTSLNPHHGTPRNPFNVNHHTGGSSSGSAVAVATGLVPLAIAADGGGSIRIPSAFNGLFGLKPTFGRVSEVGAAPLCWSVAHLGPMASSARDLALFYGVMAGRDQADHNSLVGPEVSLGEFWKTENVNGLRVGVFTDHSDDAEPQVVEANKKAIAFLQSKGAKVVEIEVPNLSFISKAHAVTILTEMASNIQRYKDHHSELGLDVQINLQLTKYFPSTYYVYAQKIRTYTYKLFQEIFKNVDVIASPSTANLAPRIVNESLSTSISDLETTTKSMKYVIVGNLVGFPAITIPIGQDSATNLPIGIQFMSNSWEEGVLLQLANLFDSNHFTALRKPSAFYSPLENK